MLLESMDLDLIAGRVDVAFTRFNNRRSLTRPCVLQEKQFGQAIAFIDKNRPGDIYYNRVIGFAERDLAHLYEMLEWYRSAAINCNISIPPHQQTDDLLRGLQLEGFRVIGSDWNFYRDPAEPLSACESGIQIEKVDAENIDRFFEHLKSTGVKIDAVVQSDVSHYYSSTEFENYFALLDGEVAASASIFLCEGIAWLSNATTVEAYRHRGCQSALLRRRIERAKQLACKTVFTDAVYGSTSHRNILRAGFELAFSSINMQLEHQP